MIIDKVVRMDMQLIIVKQEYQKRMKEHGFRIRPNIIIHVPFKNTGFASRHEGNFVVIELKHRVTERGFGRLREPIQYYQRSRVKYIEKR